MYVVCCYPVGQTLALELVGFPVLLLALLGAVKDLLAGRAPDKNIFFN
jgi:hypothetical protein